MFTISRRCILRAVLLSSFSASPLIAFVLAECPHTVEHDQICPLKPESIECPATHPFCPSNDFLERKTAKFGCKSKSTESKQCLDGSVEGLCYVEGKCKSKSGTNACIPNEATRVEHSATLKTTLSCESG